MSMGKKNIKRLRALIFVQVERKRLKSQESNMPICKVEHSLWGLKEKFKKGLRRSEKKKISILSSFDFKILNTIFNKILYIIVCTARFGFDSVL